MTVFRFSRLVGTGACALLLFVATLYLQRLPHTSGDVELLYPKESATLSALEEQQRVFEDVMYDALVLKVQSLKNMSLELEDLEQELAEIDGIVEVLAPHGVSELDPFGLVNEDTNHVRLLLKIDNRLDAAEKRHVNKNIRAVLESHSEMKPLRSGSFVTTEEVGASVSRETQRVIPLIILALAITLMSLLRSPMLCFFIVTNVGIAIGSSLLGYSLLGFPLGPLSQLAPPFLLAVGAAFHLHVAVRLRNTALEHRAAVLHELRLGVALAATTTIISLLTLCSFDIRDVTRFSLLSSAGTLLSALQALFVLPGFVRHRKSQAKHLATNCIAGLCRKAVLIAALCFCFFLGGGLWNLHVHTDPIFFLSQESTLRKELAQVGSLFKGNHFLAVVLRDEHSSPREVEMLEEAIRSTPGVLRVVGPSDFLRLQEQSSAQKFMEGFALHQSPVPSAFQTSDGSLSRIMIETELEGKDLLAMRLALDRNIQASDLPSAAQVTISSIELLLAEQTQTIVRGLVSSLSLLVGLIFTISLLFFRSVKIALVSLCPNIVPLIAVFGTLGYRTPYLNFGACLVATCALGIAVDNTFHFLLAYQSHRSSMSIPQAIAQTIRVTHQSFLLNCSVLVVGFLAMTFADSPPVADFGRLLSITLLVGLLADLVLLPCLLALVNGLSLVGLRTALLDFKPLENEYE